VAPLARQTAERAFSSDQKEVLEDVGMAVSQRVFLSFNT
jgi:hypothetical protein